MKRAITSSVASLSKNRRLEIDGGKEKEKSPTIADARILTDKLMKEINEVEMESFQMNGDYQQKQKALESLKAEREKLNNERAKCHHELHLKKTELVKAIEESKEIRAKVTKLSNETERCKDIKNRLAQELREVVPVVAEEVRECEFINGETAKMVIEADRIRTDVRTRLENSRLQLKAIEEEAEALHRQHQNDISERRKEWNELVDMLELKRRQAETLCGESEGNRRRLEEMKLEIQTDENELTECTGETKELESKIELEEQFDSIEAKIIAIQTECEAVEVQLEAMETDLHTKIDETRAEYEAEEKELNQENRVLANFQEQANIEKVYHGEKIASLKNALKEKSQALSKAEEESKLQRENNEKEWKQKQDQQTERFNKQQAAFEELRREFELLSGKNVDLNNFNADCQPVKDEVAKVKEEKVKLLSEIDGLKKRAKERMEAKKAKISTPMKSPAASSLSQLASQSATRPLLRSKSAEKQPEIRSRKANTTPKHVTFKNTPQFWNNPSQEPPAVLPVVPKPPTFIPVVPNSVQRTPSPKRQTGAVASSSKSVSEKKSAPSASNWSDSSDGSNIELPHTQAFLRRPPPTGRPKKPIPDFLGIF